jgi:hypothetical protein
LQARVWPSQAYPPHDCLAATRHGTAPPMTIYSPCLNQLSRYHHSTQQLWTVFRLNNCKTVMRLISALRMQPFVLDNWQRLPSPGKLVGNIGTPTSQLWDSIHIYNQ